MAAPMLESSMLCPWEGIPVEERASVRVESALAATEVLLDPCRAGTEETMAVTDRPARAAKLAAWDAPLEKLPLLWRGRTPTAVCCPCCSWSAEGEGCVSRVGLLTGNRGESSAPVDPTLWLPPPRGDSGRAGLLLLLLPVPGRS